MAVREGCSCPGLQLQRRLRLAEWPGGLGGVTRARFGAEGAGGWRDLFSMNGCLAVRAQDGGATVEERWAGKAAGAGGEERSLGAGEKERR